MRCKNLYPSSVVHFCARTFRVRPTRNDGSRRGMDRRAREGRAKRRHCARHGEHRPGALGPRDRRDVWDRKTPRFQGRVSAAPRSGARAGRTIARPAPSPRSVRTRLTARDRRTSQAGPPPEKTITLASLIAPRLVRRVASKSVASSGARVQPGGTDCSDPPRETPTQRGTHARPPRRFSSKNPPERLPARRVASRRVASPSATHRPRAPPRTPCQTSHVVAVPSVCLLVFFVFSSSSIRYRSEVARAPAISVCSATRVRRARLRAARRLAPRAAGSDSSSPRRSPSLSSSIPFLRAAAITPPRTNPSRSNRARRFAVNS